MVTPVKANLCHCDVCGHSWLSGIVPPRCGKCKSRNWNQGGLTKPELARAARLIERQKAVAR